MEEVEKAYLAGFFDGEGCCMISPNCSVKVIVTQKNQTVLEWMLREYGGSVHFYEKKKNGNIPKWALYNKHEILKFLADIRPYLQQKHVEVDYGIRLLELSATNTTRPQSKNGKFLPNPHKEERERIFQLYRVYRNQTSQQSVSLRETLRNKKHPS